MVMHGDLRSFSAGNPTCGVGQDAAASIQDSRTRLRIDVGFHTRIMLYGPYHSCSAPMYFLGLPEMLTVSCMSSEARWEV